MAEAKSGFKILADNRQAGHNYFLMDRMEAGLVLSGTEVKAARAGKILVDVNQNLPGRTTVCAYSLRAKDEPTASTPLDWDEVEAATDGQPLRFTSADLLGRVERLGDLFEPLLSGRRGRLPD